MKAFSVRTFTLWWVVLLSVLSLTGCGGDNNPISPGNAQITQLSSVNSQVPQNVFSSTLTGAQEVPSVTSIGSGTGVVSVDPATNQMRATIVTADVNGTQAHIHLGATGVAGPVVFSLTENETGSGVWTTTATLTTDQLTHFLPGIITSTFIPLPILTEKYADKSLPNYRRVARQSTPPAVPR